jgi:hypothetical protein
MRDLDAELLEALFHAVIEFPLHRQATQGTPKETAIATVNKRKVDFSISTHGPCRLYVDEFVPVRFPTRH